jgi:phenylpropionate dioxygenase-like ring-hydroxylating dioxygenase large terminal subunit
MNAPTAGAAPLIHDAWYVAALRRDVSQTPIARTILGRSVVLYRTSSGQAVALPNRCSHRGYPLSQGTVRGDDLECGYHGFTFDCEGVCVAVPGQDAIPRKANLSAFPLAERGPFVWIWMGSPEAADPDAVPLVHRLEEPGWTFVDGEVLLRCHYGLLIDNLLDLSHETFVHAGTIGSPEVAQAPITTEVDAEARVVHVSRRMQGVQCPPFFERFTGLRTPIDRGQDIEYHPPGLYLLHVTLVSAAEGGAPGADDRTYRIRVFYAITPAQDTSTNYFFGMARDFGHDDPELSELFDKSQHELIAEDARALEILQGSIDEQGWPSEVSIKIDTGGLAARRQLAALGDGGNHD